MTRADVRLLKRNRAWRSKLTEFEDLIRKLRRRGKSYREIAKRLREVHGVEISHNGVYSFVKARKRHQLLQMPEPFGYAACCGTESNNSAHSMSPHPGQKQNEEIGYPVRVGSISTPYGPKVALEQQDGKTDQFD